jgi:hypothetical protein
MPKLQYAGLRLQEVLRKQGSHPETVVQPRGTHLNISLPDGEGGTYVVARATALSQNRYGASFRTSGGRWEPLPIEDTLDNVAKEIVDMLGPYVT